MVFWNTLEFILVDIIWSILYFPVWWYTTGVIKVLRMIGKEIHGIVQSLHLKTLLRFLFQPMYGQTDIWSRIISIGVRFVHFIVLLIQTLVYTLLLAILFAIWIILPVFIVYSGLFHFGIIGSVL